MTAISQVDEKDNRWLRRFALLWGGQAMSLLGSRLVQFALVWHLTVQTGSTAVLATATLVALLPEVLLSPFAGALVDRWDRRKVMIFADGAVALTTVGLVLLFLTGAIQIWHIYAAMFLRGLGGAFHWPAMQASTSLMVPQKHLSGLPAPIKRCKACSASQHRRWVHCCSAGCRSIGCCPSISARLPWQSCRCCLLPFRDRFTKTVQQLLHPRASCGMWAPA